MGDKQTLDEYHLFQPPMSLANVTSAADDFAESVRNIRIGTVSKPYVWSDYSKSSSILAQYADSEIHCRLFAGFTLLDQAIGTVASFTILVRLPLLS